MVPSPFGENESGVPKFEVKDRREWNFDKAVKDVLNARVMAPSMLRAPTDTTFETHYTISDLAKQWRLGRETVRLLVKDEPGVLRICLGHRKTMTRYSVPESVARRVHTRLFKTRD